MNSEADHPPHPEVPAGAAARRPCPVCQSRDCADVGPILHPVPTSVAGVPLQLDSEFRLLKCRRCAFQFKDPPIPAEKLLGCYAKAPFTNWPDDEPRHRRFDLMNAMLQRHAPGRTVLDIGCFTGQFLHYLGPVWQRFGLEPARQAIATATSRGITILGGTIDDAATGELAFDAIAAIDVVEHIAEPLPFFRWVAAHLRPGGVFLMVTGDTDAWSWRLQKSLYWYCSALPEHVSFFCRTALEAIGGQLGMELVEQHRASHIRASAAATGVELLKNLGYVAMNRMGGLALPPLRRIFVQRRAPIWVSAADHMFCILKKRG